MPSPRVWIMGVAAIVLPVLHTHSRAVDALSAFASASTPGTTVVATEVPPLLDVPVWSMATFNDDGLEGDSNEKTATETEIGAGNKTKRKRTTNMNLLTYATPVSMRPDRLYALGLYKETKSRENFLREKSCVLQLLSSDVEGDRESPEVFAACVRLLGGASGADVCKEDELLDLGMELQEIPTDDNTDLPRVFPGCVRYLKLSMVGDHAIDCNDDGEGSHDVVVCRVDKMWTSAASTKPTMSPGARTGGARGIAPVVPLSTGRLRELGLITEQGRIAPEAPTSE